MRIVLCGISCVGKTTLGERLALERGYPFVDFDNEVSTQMDKSVSRLKDTYFNEHSYRQAVKQSSSQAVKQSSTYYHPFLQDIEIISS